MDSPGDPADKVIGQEYHIFPPFAQGRNIQYKGRQSKVEIAPEALLGDHLQNVGVGGCDDADIHGGLLGGPQFHKALCLQHTQQNGL